MPCDPAAGGDVGSCDLPASHAWGAGAHWNAGTDKGKTMAQDTSDRRILLVEDNLDTSRVMKKLLERVGYGVETADGVASALRASEREKFDLVISDVGLPDGSGLDLIRQLLAKYPVKAIALSGYDLDEQIRQGQSDGWVEHLVKPVDMQQLEAAIRRLLD